MVKSQTRMCYIRSESVGEMVNKTLCSAGSDCPPCTHQFSCIQPRAHLSSNRRSKSNSAETSTDFSSLWFIFNLFFSPREQRNGRPVGVPDWTAMTGRERLQCGEAGDVSWMVSARRREDAGPPPDAEARLSNVSLKALTRQGSCNS